MIKFRKEISGMKLTDELKKKIDNASSEEEVKAILSDVKDGAKDAGIIFDDEELDKVAAGGAIHLGRKSRSRL